MCSVVSWVAGGRRDGGLLLIIIIIIIAPHQVPWGLGTGIADRSEKGKAWFAVGCVWDIRIS